MPQAHASSQFRNISAMGASCGGKILACPSFMPATNSETFLQGGAPAKVTSVQLQAFQAPQDGAGRGMFSASVAPSQVFHA